LPGSTIALGQRGQIQGFFGPTTLYNPVTMAGGLNLASEGGGVIFLSNSNLVGYLQVTKGGFTGQVPLLIGSVGAPGIQNYCQVGNTVATPNVNGNITHTFPVAFPVALDMVVCCNGNASNNATQLTTVDKSVGFGIASFASRSINCTTGAAITTLIEVMWIAWGH
jgi:hypothetical protein